MQKKHILHYLAISFLSVGIAYVSFECDWRTVQAQDESLDTSPGIIREILTWGFDNLNPDQITFSNTIRVMDGPTGHSLNFDGKNDYVKIASSKMGHVKNLAVSAWIKPDYAMSSNQFTILSKPESFSLYLKPSGNSYHAEFSVYDGTAWHVVESKKQINSQWTKLLGVFNGRSIAIYINGTIDSSNLVQLPTLDDLFPISYDDISDADLLIGSSADGLGENNFFAGQISDVQITPSNGYLVDNIADNQPIFSDGNNTYNIPQNGNNTSDIHSNVINQTNVTNLNPVLSSSNSTISQIPSNTTIANST
ncbi:MAG TPA: LamG domain-containing protein, partial [Candidatus Nitrosotalea sp.]|nr:LamG domain-containing protein [Candidatus Nitrosotalea sp.]